MHPFVLDLVCSHSKMTQKDHDLLAGILRYWKSFTEDDVVLFRSTYCKKDIIEQLAHCLGFRKSVDEELYTKYYKYLFSLIIEKLKDNTIHPVYHAGLHTLWSSIVLYNSFYSNFLTREEVEVSHPLTHQHPSARFASGSLYTFASEDFEDLI